LMARFGCETAIVVKSHCQEGTACPSRRRMGETSVL
jgi:hypothetical protein